MNHGKLWKVDRKQSDNIGIQLREAVENRKKHIMANFGDEGY